MQNGQVFGTVRVMRLLVPIRLSRLTDATNNPAMQRTAAHEYADEHPGTVLVFTDVEDLDIGGAVPIRERPGIGPYLKPDKIGTFDGILGNEMDRISRDMLDYLLFAQDMMARGKIIIDLSDGTDTSTTRGRQILEDRVLAAQRERERIRERRAKAARRISDAGRWGGGRIRYGYMPVCVCHGLRRCAEPEHTTGWRLIQDHAASRIVLGMVDDAIDGKSFSDIARRLQAEGVQTAQGGKWRETTVERILKSPALIGQEIRTPKGVVTVRRGRDGKPVIFTDKPILTEDKYRLLQDALATRSRHRGQAQARHVLWHVGYCRKCSQPCDHEAPCLVHGVPLKGMRQPNKRISHAGYYTCKNYGQCHTQMRIDTLEEMLAYDLLEKAGHRDLLERRITRGEDFSAEIIKLERRAERFRRELDEEYDEDLERSIIKIEKRIAELLSADPEPDRMTLQPVEPRVTVAQYWDSLDEMGRNKFLRDWGVAMYADRDGADISLGWLLAEAGTLTI
jgi:DNA invertase Pin-like site-specific DNA recombinase